MGRGLISKPQNPEFLYGKDETYAFTHLGNKITPMGEHVFCLRLPMPQTGEVFIPERYLAPFGKHQAGAPLQLGIVLAKGPEVNDEVHIGEEVIIDPMNSGATRFGETWYFLPREIAILARRLES